MASSNVGSEQMWSQQRELSRNFEHFQQEDAHCFVQVLYFEQTQKSTKQLEEFEIKT